MFPNTPRTSLGSQNTAANTATAEQAVPPEQIAHYCIVRADLPFGVQAAQLIHAAGESSPGDLPPHTFAIALHARDEKHLLEIDWMLFQNGVRTRKIYEPDAPWNGQLMAIGVLPQARSRIKVLLRDLPSVR